MPLLPSDITSVTNQQISALNAQGKLAPAIRTAFRVKGQGPYYIELPLEDWTADLADKAIRTYAEELCKLIDRYPGA